MVRSVPSDSDGKRERITSHIRHESTAQLFKWLLKSPLFVTSVSTLLWFISNLAELNRMVNDLVENFHHGI
jgi:hypothetical protein